MNNKKNEQGQEMLKRILLILILSASIHNNVLGKDKKLIETSVIQPMKIADNNIGQVLIYPLYTVKNNFNTIISVTNTTNKVKALVVKFKEGKNARNVFNFMIYISANDSWQATLVPIISSVPGYLGDNSVQVLTDDTSCTVPLNIDLGEFLPYVFSPLGTVNLNSAYDGLGNNLNRSQEGFVQILEVGDVVGSDAEAAQMIDGVPVNCQNFYDNWYSPSLEDAKWAMDPSVNLVAPDGSGGLTGQATIINTTTGIEMTYSPIAIVNFTTSLFHSNLSVALNLLSGNNYTTSITSQDGTFITTWNSTIDAVTALFMKTQISNDFNVDTNFQTEWINMFPTKQFYVDEYFASNSTPMSPFTANLIPDFGSCEDHRFKAYDNFQQVNTPLVIVPPPDPLPPNYSEFPEYCWSVNIADVNSGIDINTMFDSILKTNDFNTDPLYTSITDLPFSIGTMQMNFSDEISNQGKLIGYGEDGLRHEIYGKPVIGFRVQNFFQPPNINTTTLQMNQGIRKIEIKLDLFMDGFE